MSDYVGKKQVFILDKITEYYVSFKFYGNLSYQYDRKCKFNFRWYLLGKLIKYLYYLKMNEDDINNVKNYVDLKWQKNIL